MIDRPTMTLLQRVRELMRAFEATHGRSPTIVRLTSTDELDLINEAPPEHRSKVTVHGARVMDTFLGLRIEWDAATTEVA